MKLSTILIFGGIISLAASQNTEVDLRSFLFNTSSYSRFTIPRKNSSETVLITLSWLTGYIGGLDEKAAQFTTAGSAIVEWRDDFLQWDPTNYGGIESIVIRGDEIWTPALSVFNKIDSDFMEYGLRKDFLRVSYDGVVFVQHSGVLSVICDPDPEQFPFDCQSCSLIFGSSLHLPSEISIQFSSNPVTTADGDDFKHPLWDISDLKTTVYFPSMAVITTILKRKPLYYSFSMIIPSSILSVLIIAAFFIPSDEGEKISCGMTILLSFVVFLVQIDDVVPENSNAISAIARYYMMCMASSVVMILNVIALNFIEKRSYPESKCKDSGNLDAIKVAVVDDDVPPPEYRKSTRSLKHLSKRFWSLLTPVNIFKTVTFLLSISLIAAANITLLETSNNTICKD